MRTTRHWQIGLGALLLLSTLDALHAALDIGTALQMRQALLEEITAGPVETSGSPWEFVPGMIAGALSLLLGWLLVWRAAHIPAARALIAFVITLNLPLFTVTKLGLPMSAVATLSLGGNVVFMAALVAFAATFPRPLAGTDLAVLVSARRRGRIRRLLGTPFRWLRRHLLEPRTALVAFVVAVIAGAVLKTVLPALLMVTAVWLAVSYLRAGYLLADDDGQRRVLWILNGFSAGFWILAVGLTVGLALAAGFGVAQGMAAAGDAAQPMFPPELVIVFEWVILLPLMAIMLSIAAAMLYRGAIDPGLVLRKTTLYGALGVFLAFVFAMVENVLSAHVAVRLGFPSGSGGWIAGGVIALTVGPLRRRMERHTDRMIDRMLPPTELARGDRRHSVIVFTDLAGYTALAASDPNAALTAASLLHKVAQRAANRFHGRVVKTLGDGVLFEFVDVAIALRAAEFTAESYAAAADVLELPRLAVTSGIHAGEVAESRDGDVFGEAVNLAAKIEAAAKPGEVWLSSRVVELLGMADGALVRAGAVELPGVPPVMCYRVADAAHATL